MKFVVYEVWTRARIIEAADRDEAYMEGEPAPRTDDLNLCNWHVVPVEPDSEPATSGGFNSRVIEIAQTIGRGQ